MNDRTARWQATEVIFHEAFATEEPERSTLLAVLCKGDTTLMDEVRALLAACEAEESHRLSVDPDSVRAGASVGPYVIEGLVGRGGMGAVYRARRSDGQFEQQVAIKIIDLPLASEFFRERFRAERQMLAGLTHPYIARLLDGGITEEGELYLVMEYIDGACITDFCNRQSLTVKDRIALFQKVCEAVQYAHRNLIVHRDLKPENILVTVDSTPHLLDFGTAKMIQPMTAKGIENATRTGMQVFTPQFASPEQVLGQSISIASDIYSLGVLLYVLLTGAVPYQLVDYSTEEMLRVICHQSPPKPSAVSQSAERLDSDIDAIVSMAMRKEPEQRYSTVEHFSADLQAWLDRRPVQARRGNLRYRAGRFIRRNLLPLSGAVVLCLTGTAGVAGIAWQSHVAQMERQKAQAESEDLRQLSVSLLTELDEAIKQLPGSTNAQKLLVTRVLEHLDRVSASDVPDKPTALNLADAYTRVGNLEGNPYDQNIGDAAGGLLSVTKALKLTEHWKTLLPTDAETLHAFAFAAQSQSEILFGMDRTAEAVQSMNLAASAYAALAARSDASPAQMSDASSAYGALGDELGKPGKGTVGDTAGALAAYRTAMEYQNKALKLDPKWPRALRTLPVAMLKIGNMEMATDPWDAARQFQACLEAMDRYPAEDKGSFGYKRNRSFILRGLGQALTEVRKYPQAIAMMEPARAITEEEVKADAQDLRSRIDHIAVLDNEATVYEALAEDPAYKNDRVQNRLKAQSLLDRMKGVLQEVILHNPKDFSSLQNLARAQVRIGTLQQGSAQSQQGARMAAQGLAALIGFEKQGPSSTYLDDLVTISLLTVEPAALRNPQLAIVYAERAVAASPQKPGYWCNLAQAYRAAGSSPSVRKAAAAHGRSLLAPLRPGESASATRKALEAEAR